MAVAVLLAVGLVVPLVVAHQVVQGEAVVRADVVDARRRAAAALLEQIARAREARRELAQHAVLASPGGAHGVAVFVVPFRPADRKIAELIAAFADTPGLG